MQRIVIVGGGQAGAQAAASLRSEGYAGEVVLIGAEPVLPYERPPLSKAYLKGELDSVRLHLRTAQFYADKHIEVVTGRAVVGIDRAARHVVCADESGLDYDRLLLATGSALRRLDLPGCELDGVHYLRALGDADALRARLAPGRRLVVIGGGYIGLEVAASARQLGCNVSVLEVQPRLMARVAAAEISALFTERHRRAGVELRLGCGVSSIVGGRQVEAVVLADGSRVPADAVVIGVGVLPATGLAEAAGLQVADGIVVDERCASSDPLIFAAGDATCQEHDGVRCRLESVPNAMAQGKAAARAMLGRDVPTPEVPWFWSDQYELKLQIAGLASPVDEPVVRRYDDGGLTVCHLREGRLAALETVNRPADFIAGRKLIGRAVGIDARRLADVSTSLKALL